MNTRTRKAAAVILMGIAFLAVAVLGYTLGNGQQTVDITGIGQQSAGIVGYGGVEGQSLPPEAMNSMLAEKGAARDEASLGISSSEPMQATAPADGSSAAKLVVRTATMDLRVKAMDAALDGLRDAVRKAGGELANLQVSAGDQPAMPDEGPAAGGSQGPGWANVTIKVPAEKLESLKEDISALGVVLSQSANAEDVTEQAIDMEARLRNLRAEEAQLRSFFRKTNKISELLAVERELSRVRGEIEAMDAQLTYLKRQAAMATLTVQMTQPGPVVAPSGSSWGIAEAVTRGIQAAAGLITTMITLAIPLAVLAALVALVAWPVRAVARRVWRNRQPQSHDAQSIAPEDEG